MEQKKRFSQEFKNYQNLVDLWSNDKVIEFRKKMFKAYVFTKKKARNVWNKELKVQKETMQSLFFVQKAVALGASRRLPFSTLELLGKKLAHPAYKQDIEKIIKDNVIKCNENFYKLDDLENQNKIQKALRRFQFEQCSEIQKEAA